MSNTISVKTLLVLCLILGVCYADGHNNHHVYYKKKHRHHGLYHLKYLSYLAFLAIKLKIVFFLGTVFAISAVAAKVFGVIKLMEYYKHKTHHEEKIVYVNPHEHYDSGSFGGYGGYSGYSAPVEFSSKDYSPDFSIDHPPSGAYGEHDRYTTIKSDNGRQLGGFSDHLKAIVRKLRSLNITEMALKEMGIKEEACKKKFICEAEYNCKNNPVLETGFHLLRDDSYQRYKPNATIESFEGCGKLYQDCTE
ncbi:uncharacterized protein LOC143194986 [Rhynchophorus ferrugineus]|uniref:Uncharacterized protein n=1 Tax=Rhynchophorus ferrugineus TaxID=354439 RepID=A0A834IZ46_RHYFE|nr:hypothetical protein GWI33_003182 [Rhynchophorus ferrugineus]